MKRSSISCNFKWRHIQRRTLSLPLSLFVRRLRGEQCAALRNSNRMLAGGRMIILSRFLLRLLTTSAALLFPSLSRRRGIVCAKCVPKENFG